MNVAVVFDDVAARDAATADERGVLEAVTAAEETLAKLGHRVTPVPVTWPDDGWLDALRRARPELAFNLCEGAGGSSANEARVTATIELLGIPTTGSASETLALARRKDRMNAVLHAAGLPVPAWRCIVTERDARRWLDFPAIVKPAAEDASVGITQRSVARDAEGLAAAIVVAAPFAPLLVQRFMTGREINVAVLGDEVLPLSEIDFGTLPPSLWPIVTYGAKWESGSVEDRGTTPCCPARIDESLAERARCLALDGWRHSGGRGYGRIDLRADERGNLHILEINPNPDLAPSAGFARMAAAAGYDYVQVIDRIIREAMQ